MSSEIDLFTPKAAAAIRALLPRDTWRRATAGGPAPVVTVGDWAHVRTAIGTSLALDDAVIRLQLQASDALPPAWATVLMSTVTLYAMAVDFFDTEEHVRRWWATPLSLEPGTPAHAPRDWAGLPGGSAQLASRIRRTQHGIY
jgi:hypothetical protein